MGGTKRLLVVFIAGILFTLGGATVLKKKERIDNPILTNAIALPTTVPSTTTPPVTVAPVAVSRPSRPVAAPRDSYAPEPIVQIGTIEIPKIGLFSPIMHGISLRNIDLGPSHWPGTAMPGEIGNTVFAGHRVTHTHPFLRINELEVGDPVIFHVQGQRSTYTVTSYEIVYPNELRIVNQTDTATGTLFGCHPPHSAKQRYVVHLALVDVGPDN